MSSQRRAEEQSDLRETLSSVQIAAQNLLYEYAEEGNAEGIGVLLREKKVSPDFFHCNALKLAASKGHAACVSLLLDASTVKLSIYDAFGGAVASCSVETVMEFVVRYEGDPTFRRRAGECLRYDAACRSPKIMSLLLPLSSFQEKNAAVRQCLVTGRQIPEGLWADADVGIVGMDIPSLCQEKKRKEDLLGLLRKSSERQRASFEREVRELPESEKKSFLQSVLLMDSHSSPEAVSRKSGRSI